MNLSTRAIVAASLLVAPVFLAAKPAKAGIGDLLVAPTRLVLNGGRGAEVILNNIGEEPATYRISVEFRRMKPDGTLEEVTAPSEAEKAARDMIVYAPRRVTLAPNEPQSIRISARPPAGLADGEYRIHLLFRAVPPSNPVVQPAAAPPKGVTFKLTPVYGVTIPVIVRLGNLEATAGIANVRLDSSDGKPAIALDLSRSGRRSTFGEVRVLKAGVKEPIASVRAIAVYTDIERREVVVPVSDSYTGELKGPVTVQYIESYDDGTRTIAETQAVLR